MRTYLDSEGFKKPLTDSDGDVVWDYDFSPAGLQQTCSIKDTGKITAPMMAHGWLERGDDGRAKRVKGKIGDSKEKQLYRITAETLNKYEVDQDA
jgi:hypothetical protein